MKHFVSVLLFQKLLQIITEADYRVRSFSRTGIGEGFLRMGMIDQNLRAFGIFRQGQVFSEQGAAVDLARQDRSVGIDNEEAVQERLLVSKKVSMVSSGTDCGASGSAVDADSPAAGSVIPVSVCSGSVISIPSF